MSSAVEQLVALMEDADPYAHPRTEVVPLQISALDERLAERRSQIRVVDQRAALDGLAEDAGAVGWLSGRGGWLGGCGLRLVVWAGAAGEKQRGDHDAEAQSIEHREPPRLRDSP